MPDITMCSGKGCPLSERCHRATATPTPLWQSYFVVPPVKDGTCDHFWDDVLYRPVDNRWLNPTEFEFTHESSSIEHVAQWHGPGPDYNVVTLCVTPRSVKGSISYWTGKAYRYEPFDPTDDSARDRAWALLNNIPDTRVPTLKEQE